MNVTASNDSWWDYVQENMKANLSDTLEFATKNDDTGQARKNFIHEAALMIRYGTFYEESFKEGVSLALAPKLSLDFNIKSSPWDYKSEVDRLCHFYDKKVKIKLSTGCPLYENFEPTKYLKNLNISLNAYHVPEPIHSHMMLGYLKDFEMKPIEYNEMVIIFLHIVEFFMNPFFKKNKIPRLYFYAGYESEIGMFQFHRIHCNEYGGIMEPYLCRESFLLKNDGSKYRKKSFIEKDSLFYL